MFVNVIGDDSQRSNSSASDVRSGMNTDLRRRRVFFGRHHMPLPRPGNDSRWIGPIRIKSLSRWHVMTPNLTDHAAQIFRDAG